jgi:hypothetical protein
MLVFEEMVYKPSNYLVILWVHWAPCGPWGRQECHKGRRPLPRNGTPKFNTAEFRRIDSVGLVYASL